MRVSIQFLFLATPALSPFSFAAERPNVLVIVSEDNGPELGCYGDRFARTENLDQLAADGVRFERAFVPYSVCSPSRAVFLTGLYPHQNGQIGLAAHHFSLYDPATPNAFTLLKEAGYRTGLIGINHSHVTRCRTFSERTNEKIPCSHPACGNCIARGRG